MNFKKLLFNQTNNKHYDIYCLSCINKTDHIVLSSVMEEGKEAFKEHDNYYFYWVDHFEIIQCLGCKSISFRNGHSNSEVADNDDNIYIHEYIYPERHAELWIIKEFNHVPFVLNRIYRETIDCYNKDCLILCSAGARALIEGLCRLNEKEVEIETNKKKKTVKKNLQLKIDELANNGIITKESSMALHELRFMGNTSLHELETPSKEDLCLAKDIIENILETLYEIPEKRIKLNLSRDKNKPKNLN